MESSGLPPLYTRPFWTACAVHLAGAMSLSMFVLLPLLIKEIGGNELTIGLVFGIGAAFSVAACPVVGMLLDSLSPSRAPGGGRSQRGVVAAVVWIEHADLALRLGTIHSVAGELSSPRTSPMPLISTRGAPLGGHRLLRRLRHDRERRRTGAWRGIIARSGFAALMLPRSASRRSRRP
jgi:hypothetical protein